MYIIVCTAYQPKACCHNTFIAWTSVYGLWTPIYTQLGVISNAILWLDTTCTMTANFLSTR